MQRTHRPRQILEKAFNCSEKRFKQRYGMKPTTYEALMVEVGPLLMPGDRANNFALCEDERMLSFLKFCRGNHLYHLEQVLT